jgi:hypothetical protein
MRRCPPLTFRLAAVSMISLLMVALYPVSDSVKHYIFPLPKLTHRLLPKTGEELVCVPVRITKFMLHPKFHLMITVFSTVCSTSVIGKL